MAEQTARGFNWPTGLFVIGYHVALLVGLPFYFYYASPGLPLVVASVVLLFATEVGIGAAYHRFYAHRAYKLSRPAEGLLLFLATLATQGDVLRWAFEHRLHHTFTDGERDPYSIRKGFWHAHVLWLFRRGNPVDPRWVKDLLVNPLVMFQHRHILPLTFGSNLAVCALVGWLTGDFLGAFVLAWWTRMAVSHHLTWFVNSLCHMWGERTFSKEQSAVDNYVLAIMTVGEGYHNYHHTFPSDYRNGVRWYHIDPTKWTIWLLGKLGQAHDLKRVGAERIAKRLLVEDRKLLVDRLAQDDRPGRTELRERVERLANRIHERLARRSYLVERLAQLRRAGASALEARAAARANRRELRSLRQDLRRDWRAWHRLCGIVLEA
jgi:stearoyl-CoA desaturase (delta-9 desaturase)